MSQIKSQPKKTRKTSAASRGRKPAARKTVRRKTSTDKQSVPWGFVRIPKSKRQKVTLLAAIVGFAAVGTYLVFFTKAAVMPVATVEAESMSLPAGGKLITDTAASEGKAVQLTANGTSSGQVTLPSAASQLTIRGKGSQCQGAPQMVVKIDGAQVQTSSVSSSAWADYSAAVNIAAGAHTVTVDFTNDHNRYKGRKLACSRDLYIDKLVFSGTVADPVVIQPPTVTPDPTPPPPSSPQKITAWRPAGSAPLSDADAASRVSPAGEIRPSNATANAYRPTAAELDTFRTGWRDSYNRTPVAYDPSMALVTGNFSGTTDEIIQWGAHKWGIPEDWVRAQAVTESWWYQSTRGDQEDGKTPSQMSAYPAYSHIDSDSVFSSLGLMQDKWHPECEWNTAVACKAGGIEPLRHKSTAFSVDYTLATIKYYFDGKCYWCTTGYAAGQEWESISAHYNPYPWKNSGQLNYINTVKNHLASRTWEKPGF